MSYTLSTCLLLVLVKKRKTDELVCGSWLVMYVLEFMIPKFKIRIESSTI